MKYLKSLAFSFLALIIGIIGLMLLFSDFSGEFLATRILIGTLFFLLSGGVIGFFNPTLWMISGLTACGGVLMGGIITLSSIHRYHGDAFSAQEPPYISAGLVMLFLPLAFSLIGGYVGKLLSQMQIRTYSR